MTFPLSLLLISILTLINSTFSATILPASLDHNVYSHFKPQGEAPPYVPPQTNSRSASLTSSRISHIQTSSAAPARSTTVSHRGAGDPCGPQGNQTDFESTLNTCGQINTTYTDAPSIYGVQCLNTNPSWNQSINTTSCASNINDICAAIVSSQVTASQWTWSSGGPNCTVGIWFNPRPAASPLLQRKNCRTDIYQLMQSTCFPSQGRQFNVAAVNLRTLPDVRTNGSQVDPGYPSYIIVPETYDNIYNGTPAADEPSDGDEEGGGEGEEEGGEEAEYAGGNEEGGGEGENAEGNEEGEGEGENSN
ncbi:hypothetical protein HO173_010560 [Letharia columbiana]|uniref:Uncharacterized protein n=1 Tax=Letharia columbiana TaxID=112416 RepID=A0A8H6FMF4_9LECA|nr:uncharacterized protein HO173_010560 [Letharia columbiana]KAF6231228.1 hypothetical protein HO173_010560 [Letharia columbiana]